MINPTQISTNFYQSENLIQQKGIVHFFSTKRFDFEQLDQIALHFEIKKSNIVIGKQTHSDQIEIIDQQNMHFPFIGVDAFITKLPGICIAVKTADCTPVLLFDPIRKVVAAIHSGWRGTIHNITGKTILKMKENYQVQAQNIIAAIGPCIGQHNYQVGEEVADQFRTLFPGNPEIVLETIKPAEKAKVSVRQAIFQQLLNAEVQAENIAVSQECTFNNSTNFHSARRDGTTTGRMINGIWLK
ncbi:MAG: peptidoglycan editing factor PgeF [Prolixibacteraceae bacterium]